MLGSPIGHSLSPALHRAAYAELGLDWTYEAIECTVADLAATVARLSTDYAGLSLTMPLKQAVLPLLDRVDDSVTLVGACNTVVFDDDAVTGYNTDVAGVHAALDELASLAPADRAGSLASDVVVLGGGGAALAVLTALAHRNFSSVTVVVRRPEKAAAVTALAGRLSLRMRLEHWSRAADLLAAASLVVATTPAGTTDALGAASWPTGTALFDVVYAPWPTALGAAAARAGAPVVGGLPMLIGQAAEQVTLMTGRLAPVAAMRSAGEAALAAR